MNNKQQLAELIEIFLNYADELLKKGAIDPLTYEQITENKRSFLKELNGY